HGATIVCRPGVDEGKGDNIGERRSWDETPLRCLHACFIRRSSGETDGDRAWARPILEETGMQDRSLRGLVKRFLRRQTAPRISAWKREKYMRGDLVTVDASPFFYATRTHP